jgi:hypothetical protein
MALFKEINCVHCGKKTTPIIRTRLKDDTYVCNTCKSTIPTYIRNCLDNYDRDDFEWLVRYMAFSNEKISKVFKQTHHYECLHLDATHGYFYISGSMLTDRLYLQIEDVESITLEYVPEVVKEGFLTDKVKGDVMMKLEVNAPHFRLSKKIASGVKAEANLKKGVFSNKVKYENPKGMDAFIAQFQDTYNRFLYSSNGTERFE